jgi:hypothetical protein
MRDPAAPATRPERPQLHHRTTQPAHRTHNGEPPPGQQTLAPGTAQITGGKPPLD